jgi:hypothetical protein
MHGLRSAARRFLELHRYEIMIRCIGGIADGIMPDESVSEPDADVRACTGPWQRAACFRLQSKGFDTFSLNPDGGDANRDPVLAIMFLRASAEPFEQASAGEEHGIP